MSVPAMRWIILALPVHSMLASRINKVVFLRANKHVLRVHAGRHITGMADDLSFSDASVDELINSAMRTHPPEPTYWKLSISERSL